MSMLDEATKLYELSLAAIDENDPDGPVHQEYYALREQVACELNEVLQLLVGANMIYGTVSRRNGPITCAADLKTDFEYADIVNSEVHEDGRLLLFVEPTGKLIDEDLTSWITTLRPKPPSRPTLVT